jgi:hypothetical protein
MSINEWQTYITIAIALLLAFLKVINYSVTWGKFQQRTYIQAEFELLKLDKKEPKRNPWRAFNVITLLFCISAFVYDGFFIKTLIQNWNNFQWNSSFMMLLLIFFLFAVALPIFLLWDTIIGMLNKQNRIEWSATLQVEGELSSVFKHCQIILLNIGASLTSLNKNDAEISARLRRYIISIKVNTINDKTSCVLIEMSNAIRTLMPDLAGGNIRNIIEQLIKGFYKIKL